VLTGLRNERSQLIQQYGVDNEGLIDITGGNYTKPYEKQIFDLTKRINEKKMKLEKLGYIKKYRLRGDNLDITDDAGLDRLRQIMKDKLPPFSADLPVEIKQVYHLLTKDKLDPVEYDLLRKNMSSYKLWDNAPMFKEVLGSNGVNAVTFGHNNWGGTTHSKGAYRGKQTAVFSPDSLVTDKQLTDIYNQATTPQVDKSKTPTDKSQYRNNLEAENPETLVLNDGWESYRKESIKRYEEQLNSDISSTQKKGIKQNIEALKNAKPNEVYRINPSTGRVEVHPASELLGAFSKYIGDDVPPIVIGNVKEPGSMRRLPSNWAGANGTYTSKLSRLDYKTKNSVYHETMHHIDHFIRG
jgi:hypothetical protein